MTYYSERTQHKISEGKTYMRWSLEETRQKLPRVLSQWNHAGHTEFTQQWVVTTSVKCCLPGTLIKDSMPRVFTGGWTRRHPLPSSYQNFRLLERRLVFSINKHIACTNRLGTASLSYQGIVGNFHPEIQVPRCWPQVNLASGPF